MTKDRKKKRESCYESQRPSQQIATRWNYECAQLQGMLPNICGNQHHAYGKHNEPAIVDAHRNAIDTRDQDLPFEKSFEVSHQKSKGKRKKARCKTPARSQMFLDQRRKSRTGVLVSMLELPLPLGEGWERALSSGRSSATPSSPALLPEGEGRKD